MFEAVIVISLAFVVGIQWFTIVTYRERFERIGRVIKKIQQTKSDIEHTHSSDKQKYIGGDMDIVYKVSKASVKAHIYPRKIK